MWSEHYTPPGVPTQGPWELKAKFGPQWRQVLVVGAVQFSAGTFNHIYGVYHCVVSNSSFSG